MDVRVQPHASATLLQEVLEKRVSGPQTQGGEGRISASNRDERSAESRPLQCSAGSPQHKQRFRGVLLHKQRMLLLYIVRLSPCAVNTSVSFDCHVWLLASYSTIERGTPSHLNMASDMLDQT